MRFEALWPTLHIRNAAGLPDLAHGNKVALLPQKRKTGWSTGKLEEFESHERSRAKWLFNEQHVGRHLIFFTASTNGLQLQPSLIQNTNRKEQKAAN
ncbi:hypothetical protein EJB05_15421, partial [Eragrostis curvula]